MRRRRLGLADRWASLTRVGSSGVRILATTGFAAALLACAPMGRGPATAVDSPRAPEEVSVSTGALKGELAQNGTTFDVRAHSLCDVRAVRVTERTTTWQHQNQSPATQWWALAAGGALLAVGAVAVSSPQSFVREFSPGEARAGGYGAIGLGAFLASVPVIEHFREKATFETKVEVLRERGEVLRPAIACALAPDGTLVELVLDDPRAPKRRFALENGAVHGDLTNEIAPDVPLRQSDTGTIHVAGTPVGHVTLAALYGTREATAASAAEQEDCAARTDAEGCPAHEHYVVWFPEGERRREFERRLAAARARWQAEAEVRAWARAAEKIRECGTPRAVSSDEMEAACEPLRQYARDFPDGPRVALAGVVLGKAQLAIDRRRRTETAALDRKRRMQEAAERADVAATPGQFIPYPGNGLGPTLCGDGSWSHSSGRGTCSHHGGIGGGSGKTRGHGSGLPRGHRGGGKRR